MAIVELNIEASYPIGDVACERGHGGAPATAVAVLKIVHEPRRRAGQGDFEVRR